jgi:hypothetical protein
MDKSTNTSECRCDCVNCVTENHGDCYYRPSVCPFGPSKRTENGLRLHDQHCAWCDCEEFAAVQYGTLHHLSERAAKAVSAAVTQADTEFASGLCGNEEIILCSWWTSQ